MAARSLVPFALLAVFSAGQAGAADVSAELGMVSDYRFRGLSLSDERPAVQGSVTIEHGGGLYGEVWASSIREEDFGADVELDVTAGYAVDVSETLSLDLSATGYIYPGEADSNYVEGAAVLEFALDAISTRIGLSFVPGQRGTRDEQGQAHRNFYMFAGASYELPGLPLTLSAQLGRERGYFDEAQNGSKLDWSLGGELKLDRFRLGLAYSGSDAARDRIAASLFADF